MAYTLLVVDDSRITRSMVKKAIKMSGLETNAIFEAGDGKEGLAVLRSEWIDLVFADVHMPIMTGIEMVEEMSSDPVLKLTPVVMVSSDRNQDHINHLRRLGVKAYIHKPFKPEQFREILSEIIDDIGGDRG